MGRRHRRAEGLGCGAVGTGELIGVRLRGGGHRRAEGLGCGAVGSGGLGACVRGGGLRRAKRVRLWDSGHRRAKRVWAVDQWARED